MRVKEGGGCGGGGCREGGSGVRVRVGVEWMLGGSGGGVEAGWGCGWGWAYG